MTADQDEKRGAEERHGPRYPARDALPTRVAASSAETVPDDAATALDRPRFTEEMLASWAAQPASSSNPPAPDPRRKAGSPVASLSADRTMWIVAFALAVGGGLLGALFGLWLALGG